MTKPRVLPAGYVGFIVEASSEFSPLHWRQKPDDYRVVESVGVMKTLGQADSWMFMHNRAAIQSASTEGVQRWAIYISIKNKSLSRLAATQRRAFASANE